ncbi:hypothetical protein GW17_00013586 [Ensete ventricosum]|nr:hypothetical protein GW17_00013586 [Ensete ventricosum]
MTSLIPELHLVANPMPKLHLMASHMPELRLAPSPMPELHLVASPMPELHLATNPITELCIAASMIGVAGELDCFSAHIRLRELGKSENKTEGVEAGGRKGRGSDDEFSGAQLPKRNSVVQLLNSSSGEQLGAKRHVAAEQKIEDLTKGEEIQPLIAIVLASMAVPSKAEVLSLLRSLLKTARKFGDYNIREYARRRAVDGFRENTKLSDPSAIATAFAEGTSQLEVAKRQASVYTLYAPSVKSVMEVRSL